jgi:hypothetical protein
MEFTALISGLIGALIGSLTSLGTLIVQNVYQTRRESTRLVFETAYKDYELRILKLPDNIAPFPVILAYHQEMARLIEHDRLTPEAAKGLMSAQAAMTAAIRAAVHDLSGPDPSST